MTMNSNLSAWSCQGLVAHFNSHTKVLSIIDQTVPISDPFYLQVLSQGNASFDLKVLEWNSDGKYLLTCSRDGSIEIFGERIGLVNRFESLYKHKTTDSSDSSSSIISSIWCENRRNFLWNSSALQNNNLSNSFINSKSVSVDFVPADRLGFILVRTDGLIEIFIETITIITGQFENNENNSITSSHCSSSKLLNFSKSQFSLFSDVSASQILDSVIATQSSSSNGKVLLFAKCSAAYGKFWKSFELGKASSSVSSLLLTTCDFDENDMAMICIENDNTIEVTNGNVNIIEKFIWTTRTSTTDNNTNIFNDELVHLHLDNTNSLLTIDHYTSNLVSIPEKKSVTILPFSCSKIFYSPRCTRYFLSKSNESNELNSSDSDTGKCEILVINLSGQILKSFQLETFNEEFLSENENRCGPMVFSPNGCCIGRVCEIETDFPRLFYSIIDDVDINPNSTHKYNRNRNRNRNHNNLNNLNNLYLLDITLIRELIGKIISSTLNNTDSWDIFRVLSHSVNILQEKEKDDDEDSAGGLFSFLSTFLSEWISLLEISGIPPSDFYGKLYEIFKKVNLWDSNVLNLIDISLNFSNVKNIISTAFLSSNSSSCLEELEETSDTNLFDFNYEKLQFEPEIFISLLPILETFTNFISQNLNFNQKQKTPRDEMFTILLLILNDEIFKQISIILSLSNFVTKKLSELSDQRAFPFYRKASVALQTALNQISKKIFNIQQQQPQPQTTQNHIKLLENFLMAVRNDPQIQTKCSKNLFLFLIETSFDLHNGKKLFSHVLRIFSRYSDGEPSSSSSEESGLGVGNLQVLKRKQEIRMNSNLPILEEESSADDVVNSANNLSFFDSVRMFKIPIKSLNSVLICRRCHRATSTTASQSKSTTNYSKRSRAESVYSAGWQKSIWKSRCQCGGMQRLLSLKKQ